MRPIVPPACQAIDEQDDFDPPSSQESSDEDEFLAVPLSQAVAEAWMAEATVSELLQSSTGNEPDVANLDDFAEFEVIQPLPLEPGPRDVWALWREYHLAQLNQRTDPPATYSVDSEASTILWVPECPREAHIYLILTSEDPNP